LKVEVDADDVKAVEQWCQLRKWWLRRRCPSGGLRGQHPCATERALASHDHAAQEGKEDAMSKDISGLITLPGIEYETARINDLVAHGQYDRKGRFDVSRISLGDMSLQPTQRFWDSLCARFSFGPTIFRLFNHKEVFDRIAEKNTNCAVKLAIQTSPCEHEYVDPATPFKPRLLAVSSPNAAMLHLDEAIRVLNQLDVSKVDYGNGCVISQHEPKNNFGWKIGPDEHQAKFVLRTPIDGYGGPKVFLSLVRMHCTNMLWACSKPFQAGIILGKSGACETLIKAMESYNNEDGFMALKARIEAAQRSWASVAECQNLAKAIEKLNPNSFRPEFTSTLEEPATVDSLLIKLSKLVGNIREIYGVAQIESLSEKRIRQLPSKALVYDLICFTTEIATHQLTPDAAQTMYNYFGRLVGSDLFDLENSCEEFREFSDFLDPSSKKMLQVNKVQLN
jgi:hypothetical protein